MNIITLDTETYFDNDYSLRKLTTENYVRGSQFELLCCGVKYNRDPAICANSVPNLAFDKNAVLCHHAHFDGFILNHHYGIRPFLWFDTLSMARLVFPHDKSHSLESLADKFSLGVKTVPYNDFKGKHYDELVGTDMYECLCNGCKQDVELTNKLFYKLLQYVPAEELKVIDLTIRMFTEPVLKLDKLRASKYLAQIQEEQEAILSKLGYSKKDLGSSEKFAGILKAYGIDPPVKISPRTGKETYAFSKTDQGLLELLENENEEVRTLTEARLSVKSTIGETRTERLLSMDSRGDLPVYLKYYGAHTGRWSGGDGCNFQNFKRGSELRKSLIAPDGYVLCVIDLSQIEVRMLAHMAKEDWLLCAFEEGRDLYCEMASQVYGRTITKADETERFVGKTLVIGCGYGTGWKKLQGVLKLKGIIFTEQQARDAVAAYRQMNPNIVALWKMFDNLLNKIYADDDYSCDNICGCMKVRNRLIYLPNGACVDYTNLKLDPNDTRQLFLDNPKGRTKIWGGVVTENLDQALSRIVLSQAALKLSKMYKIVLLCHDEIVYLVPEKEADDGLKTGMQIMTTSPSWAEGIPLNAEGGYAKEYSK